MSSDDDSDGIPPPGPPNLGSTGAFRRLESTGKFCVSVSRSPIGSMSIGQSPTSPQSSFRWDRGQSFRVYPMSRRGTQGTLGDTLGSEGLSRSIADISPAGSPVHTSCAARIKVAHSGLRSYLALRAVPISGSSTIRKGRLIASGGYASVYSGLDTANNEIVAIKELLMGATDTAASFKDVEEEFALIRRLRHENVVRYRFFDYSHSQRKCRIVLEFLSGGSMQGFGKRGPVRESVLKKLARDIFRGLSFIHEEGIVHRDIKPANILVSARGIAKLGDFGCSKRISESSSATNHLFGTPMYMSPEFIKGNMHRKADIWAAGCTLFELATGCLPWHHTRIKDHLPLMLHITTTYESPLVLPKNFGGTFSEEFADFLELCFERSLDKRPDAKTLLEHSWLTQVSAADVEGQQYLEDMCADMCTELCEALSLDEHRDSSAEQGSDIVDVGGKNPDSTLSQSITKRTSISSAADSPRLSRSPCHSHSLYAHSRLESGVSEVISGAFEADEVGLQQYFVLNENNNTFEIVNAHEADLAAVPVMSLESTMAASTLGLAPVSNGSGPLDATLCDVSATSRHPLESDALASHADSPVQSVAPSPITPSLTPTNFADGPRQVNVSFSQGFGRRVKLGLTVEPSDVSVRLIDKKASFVLAMNNNIRAQIASAFAEHAANEADDVGADGDVEDNDDTFKCIDSARTDEGSPTNGATTPRPRTANGSFDSAAATSVGGRRTPSMSNSNRPLCTRTKSRLQIFEDEVDAEDDDNTATILHIRKKKSNVRSGPEDDAHYRSFSSAIAVSGHHASTSSNTPIVNVSIGAAAGNQRQAPRSFTPQRVTSEEGFSLHNSPSRAHGSRSISPSFVGEIHASSKGFDGNRLRKPVPRPKDNDDNATIEISHSPANSSDTEKVPSRPSTP